MDLCEGEEEEDDFGQETSGRSKKCESPRHPIKSTAVVKRSTGRLVANFERLRLDTDLNRPPSNWLRSTAESYSLQPVPAYSSGFSSLRMAHAFPDCVGEVDVISDAENIKKLLKIPYSETHVSMMVHRVENTVLIDEFDVHKHLMRTAETEWEWLKSFFFDNVLKSLSDKEKRLLPKNNSRCALQERSLVSKFLYHSLAMAAPTAHPTEATEDCRQRCMDSPTAIPLDGPRLPEPRAEEQEPDPSSFRRFSRDVVWQFEELRMLIGSDLPIFGGTTRPCVSLRLRDVRRPINVLTGLDYWLDNLMCNVPELVMCYHLDGFVQKYELIKTEDLPQLEGSKFSPKVIRDVAQNILSFLKANAAKAGHTYWLFKGKGDDAVKLYDLSSLGTPDGAEDKGQNPFTVPVAMLLYRVARNMRRAGRPGTLRLLLQNCTALLAPDRCPQIAASAHFMLADLSMPADADPAAPAAARRSPRSPPDNKRSTMECEQELSQNLESHQEERSKKQSSKDKKKVKTIQSVQGNSKATHDSKEARSHSTENENEPSNGTKKKDRRSKGTGLAFRDVSASGDVQSSPKQTNIKSGEKSKGNGIEEAQVSRDGTARIAVTALSRAAGPNRPRERATAPNWTPAQRCEAALEHVAQGLRCLHFCADKPAPDEPEDRAEDVKEEKPSFARPFQAIPMPYSSLQEDAAAPTNDKSRDSGGTSSKAALDRGKTKTPAGWREHLRVLLLEKAALAYAAQAEQAAQVERHAAGTRALAAVVRCHRAARALAGAPPDDALLGYFLCRAGDCCLMAVQSWSTQETAPPSAHDAVIAQEVSQDTPDPPDPLGDTLRALDTALDSLRSALAAGIACYATALAHEPSAAQRDALRRRLGNAHNELAAMVMRGEEATARTHLVAATALFRKAGDAVNLALVLCNEGRLERQQPGSARLRAALSCYRTAHAGLGSRSSAPPIWDTVGWEMSTTLYLLATNEQDAAGPAPIGEAARDISKLLHAALDSCTDGAQDTPRRPVYEFRAAALHHRLGALHATASDRQLLRLARRHWALAAQAFARLERPAEFLRAQLDHEALLEAQAHEASTPGSKMKLYEAALALIAECRPILRLLAQRRDRPIDAATTDADDDEAEQQAENKLAVLLKQRATFVLLKLTQLSAKGVKGALDGGRVGYKALYGACLASVAPETAPELAAILLDVLAPLASSALESTLDDLGLETVS